MKIIKNEKLIKRNGSIGGWALGGSMISLGGALYVNIFKNPMENTQFVYLMMGGFFVGYILMLIGLYFLNRFGGSPRIDEKIDTALKGLPGDFTIYHFAAPAPHLLVGPAGIWVLLPYRQRGVMTYTKNRWRVKNGGFSQTYMSIFGLEGIGRPDLEAENAIDAVKRHLAKNLSEDNLPEVRVALLLMNEQMEFEAEGAPLPVLKTKQLKEFIRQKVKEKPIGQSQLAAVRAALPE